MQQQHAQQFSAAQLHTLPTWRGNQGRSGSLPARPGACLCGQRRSPVHVFTRVYAFRKNACTTLSHLLPFGSHSLAQARALGRAPPGAPYPLATTSKRPQNPRRPRSHKCRRSLPPSGAHIGHELWWRRSTNRITWGNTLGPAVWAVQVQHVLDPCKHFGLAAHIERVRGCKWLLGNVGIVPVLVFFFFTHHGQVLMAMHIQEPPLDDLGGVAVGKLFLTADDAWGGKEVGWWMKRG